MRPNKEEYIQLETSRNKNKNRNRKSSNHNKGGVNNCRNINKKVEQEPKSKNMFSGLESSDSNDELAAPVDEDDFITVEKKSKNIYKPKKTPALAIEGGKIYSNVPNKSGKSNNSKRN